VTDANIAHQALHVPSPEYILDQPGAFLLRQSAVLAGDDSRRILAAMLQNAGVHGGALWLLGLLGAALSVTWWAGPRAGQQPLPKKQKGCLLTNTRPPRRA
jgi:hypothetical protein